jgi:endonuclease/exonuclease/phosphatase family metal-dependent hydrolase
MFRLLLLMVLTASSLRAGETLRLLSYNIHHGAGMDNKLDLSRVAAFIKQQKPDIVFLQEVDKNCTRTKNVDQVAELGKLTGMKPVFAKFMNFQGGEYPL